MIKKFKAQLLKIHLFNKRQKIIFSSLILSIGLLSTQLVPFYLTYKFIFALAILAYLLSLWSLLEGINKLKAVILMILPTLFTLSVASYYFLLPIRWLTRLPVAFIFGLSFYSLLLAQNVFNVASIRTIPLYRAASTVSFLFTLITAFLLFNVVYSFNLFFIWNGVVIFLLSLPLIIQVIWSLKMENLSSLVILTSLVLSLVMGEVALALSFWPISTPMWSLTLSAILYLVLGVITHQIRDRLTKEAVVEYLTLASVVFVVAYLTTSWSG